MNGVFKCYSKEIVLLTYRRLVGKEEKAAFLKNGFCYLMSCRLLKAFRKMIKCGRNTKYEAKGGK